VLAAADKPDLGLALNLSPLPHVVLDAEFRFADLNDAFLQAVFKSRDDLIGNVLFDVFTSEDVAEIHLVKHSLNTVMKTGLPHAVPVIYFPVAVTGPAGARFLSNRYWSVTHTPIKDTHGKITHILQQIQDVSEVVRLRRTYASLQSADPDLGESHAHRLHIDNLRLASERSQLMDMFIQAPGFVAILYSDEHRVLMLNAACAELLGHRDVLGKTMAFVMPELVRQGYKTAMDKVYQTGIPFQARQAKVVFEHPDRAEAEARYLDFMFHPLREMDGQITGIFVQGHDVTEVFLADQRQKLMIDELNHRVKNTLATVQSIALQTARTHVDAQSFAQAFQARILALSHTHDLLTKSHWEGADLGDVIRHEIAAYGANRLTLDGAPVALEPPMAVSLGMIFHELATNAAKYGALTPGYGQVEVSWTVEQDGSLLNLLWSEKDGPGAKPPKRRGFGSRLIERNVRHDLSGQVETYFTDAGFRAQFSIPLTKEG
jgi:two-component sensor histidine kinase